MEEVLAELQEAQDSIRTAGARDVVCGSLDIKALYLSLDQEESAYAAAQFVRDSDTEIVGVNWRHAQVFVTSNMGVHELRREKLTDLVPWRLKTEGRRPGPTTKELSSKQQTSSSGGIDAKPQTTVQSKWAETNPDMELLDTQKRVLLAAVVLFATRPIFHHHMYSLGGQVFCQAKGGPIGLRFMSVITRIVMDQWLARFLGTIQDAGVTMYGTMKYVDNINLVLLINMGTRWVQGTLVHKPEWEQEDREAGRSQQQVTMTAMR